MKCIKCGKEHDNMFRQWITASEDTECDICEECIKNDKVYHVWTSHSDDSDMTFIFAEAIVWIDKENGVFVMLSQQLIGYVYGRADENDDFVKDILAEWFLNQGNDRANLLRQSFNENNKDEEILY